jgi:hypothetical protein
MADIDCIQLLRISQSLAGTEVGCSALLLCYFYVGLFHLADFRNTFSLLRLVILGELFNLSELVFNEVNTAVDCFSGRFVGG